MNSLSKLLQLGAEDQCSLQVPQLLVPSLLPCASLSSRAYVHVWA